MEGAGMEAKKKLRFSGIFILVLITIFCFVTIKLSNARKIEENGLDEIYEIDSSLLPGHIIGYFCMVCDPPSKKQELTALTEQYLTEERINDFITRAEEKAESLSMTLNGVWVIFIEPSERLSIGVFPEPNTILTYFPEDYQIARVSLNYQGTK